MMTHKPDEIKKGLNDPIHVHYHHGDREPHMTPLAMIDLEQLHADALALIQQLEATVSEKEKVVAELLEKVEQLQAERDAAVRELEVVAEKAEQVDAYIDDYIHADVDYSTYLDARNMVDNIVNWEYESEWRGVSKEK